MLMNCMSPFLSGMETWNLLARKCRVSRASRWASVRDFDSGLALNSEKERRENWMIILSGAVPWGG